jgi:hypothetical protein
MRLDHRALFGLMSAIAALALATFASAQERAGVVTTLTGRVTVARASSSEPTALKFRDDVFVRDRIATGPQSFARILLGGKAVVTVREFSAVTITEASGVATVNVGNGRVAVAVARERMQPGEVVEVRTPNAVAGIRGTVIVAEVFDAGRTVITVLKGVIDVTHLDAGRAVGASTVLNALQRVTVTGAVSSPVSISSDAARRLGAEFRTAPASGAPAAGTAAVAQSELDRVIKDLSAASVSAVSVTAPLDTSSINGKMIQSNQPTGDSDKSKGAPSDIATISVTPAVVAPSAVPATTSPGTPTSPGPTVAPAPSVAPSPTVTPGPTVAPGPTATPGPTVTPSPTVAPAPKDIKADKTPKVPKTAKY